MEVKFSQYVINKHIFKIHRINLYRVFHVAYINKSVNNDLQPVLKRHNYFKCSVIFKSLFGIIKFLYKGAIFRIKKSHPIFFYCHNNRIIGSNEKVFDIYNYQIISNQNRKDFFIYQDYYDDKSKLYNSDITREDLLSLFAIIYLFIQLFGCIFFAKKAKEIQKEYPLLGFSKRDIYNIILKFFAQYYAYRFVLRIINPVKVLLIVPYTREGFIAACKYKKINVTELMHGRITQTNLFYDLRSPIIDEEIRYLCPDNVLVYGDYWKEQLVKMNFLEEKKIKVIGYYLFGPAVKKPNKNSDVVTILITTQHTIQDEFIEYINFLSEKLDSQKNQIIIKPHPAENYSKYLQLVIPGFISVSHDSVYNLLPEANIHISAYSTVLFEALRYDVCNYSLYIKKVEEQWNEIIESGVAKPLYPDELPSLYFASDNNTKRFFADFNPNYLQKLLYS